MLEGVSRTFALTIPQLPKALAPVVANAYLLCRIIDTIEDEPALDAPAKRALCKQFLDTLAGEASASAFAGAVLQHLPAAAPPAVRELIRQSPRVVASTHSFNPAQQSALVDCVRVMGQGMIDFQEQARPEGLPDLASMDRYCYCVAGVVGEMLTRLFCEYSPAIAAHRQPLMQLAVSFGQGLQMTNILKDLWEDHARGACWLPRDVFAKFGFDLAALTPGNDAEGYVRGMTELTGIAHAHLQDALRYTLLIPRNETGIRNFCLWAIGMALLTLRKIQARPRFTSGAEVKISRRSVKTTIIASRVSARWDYGLELLFRLAARGLPIASRERH